MDRESERRKTMKFAAIKEHDVAIVTDNAFVPVQEVLMQEHALPAKFSMLDLIAGYSHLRSALTHAADADSPIRLDPKLLKPPVERPSKIWAAAGNYRRGSDGLGDARGRGRAAQTAPAELL
jgi:hypothetical protein